MMGIDRIAETYSAIDDAVTVGGIMCDGIQGTNTILEMSNCEYELQDKLLLGIKLIFPSLLLFLTIKIVEWYFGDAMDGLFASTNLPSWCRYLWGLIVVSPAIKTTVSDLLGAV